MGVPLLIPELKSGMLLEPSPLREQMTELIAEANFAVMLSFGAEYVMREADAELFKGLGQIAGVTCIEEGNFDKHEDYQCMHYALGTERGEEWAQQGDAGLRKHYGTAPLTYLATRGYSIVDNPVVGDVIAYTQSPVDDADTDKAFFDHYGVVLDKDMVVSKFGCGPIAEHPLQLIPSDWGNFAYFLGKTRVKLVHT